MTVRSFNNIVKAMKRVFAFGVFAVAALCLCGCSSLYSLMRPVRSSAEMAEILPPYSGPKARVVLANFEPTAAKATEGVAQSLRRMLLEVLVDSKRFSLARQQAEPGVDKAGVVISVQISEFEPYTSGGRAGLGGGGGSGGGLMGGLLDSSAGKAHMALEIKIADASTAAVIRNLHIHSEASAGGQMKRGFLPLCGELAAYVDTPMEKAVKNNIIEAVRGIAQAVPADYYKY